MKKILVFIVSFLFAVLTFAESALKVGSEAPSFKLKNQNGEEFDLASRKGKGWTVLFFYPKAGTPGCTTEVCAFRDAIKEITSKNALVYGISVDTVSAQKKFHDEHKLVFDLLADEKAEVAIKFKNKMSLLDMANRTTFILDPDLHISKIEEDVDPAADAKKVSEDLVKLQKEYLNKKVPTAVPKKK